MKIEFIDKDTKALLWTGDLGFPIPRAGEYACFDMPTEVAGQYVWQVDKVVYDIKPGMGNSKALVMLYRALDFKTEAEWKARR